MTFKGAFQPKPVYNSMIPTRALWERWHVFASGSVSASRSPSSPPVT